MKNTVLFLLPFVVALVLVVVGVFFGSEVVGNVLTVFLLFGILSVLGLIIKEYFGD